LANKIFQWAYSTPPNHWSEAHPLQSWPEVLPQLIKLFLSRPSVTFLAVIATLLSPGLAFGDSCSPHQNRQDFILCVRAKAIAIFERGPAKTMEQLSGARYESFFPPNSNSSKGIMNSGIYRVNSEGKSLLIKTMIPDLNIWISDQSFERDLFGVLLGAELGGPKLTRAGRFEGQFGRQGYYLEMEEIFPKDKTSFTLKGLFSTKNQFLAQLGLDRISKSQLEKVGQMMGQLLERNIHLGVDADLILSGKTGEVRWIDTTDWSAQNISPSDEWFHSGNKDHLVDGPELKGFFGRMSVHNYGLLIMYFYRLKPRYGETVLSALRREIAQSKVWSDQQKFQLWDNIRNNLQNDWKWKGSELKSLDLSDLACERVLNSSAQ
jgi:hypothetical protein